MTTELATILVVDDTEASRYTVGRILQKARFTVLEASCGADALQKMAAKPDLVILDVNLPDISGYEVCRQIKADPAMAATPVLHLSASFVESENRSAGLESGADGYLCYPLEARELVANVEALLRIRRAERAAREERELLRVTLGSIGDGVIATDARGTVTFINPVARDLTGWGEDAVGRPLPEVFRIVNEQTGAPADNPVDAVIRTGQRVGLANHSLLIARDGAARPIDDTASPIRDGDGRFIGVVLVFRDVTERRRTDQELQRRADALKEADRRKDEFLAMLAHELRNPLAPIRNILQLLRLRFGADAEFDQASDVMERQVVHLVRLIDDLMDVSRITRGKVELRRQRMSLAAAVRRAVEAARPFLDERKHDLEVALPAEDVVLDADPDRLEQIVTNLLTNAAKYTPPGGRVWVTAAREGAEAVVRVRDNGIGIRPEMLPRLFEMFQQADRVPGRVSEGLGIGLGLVRILAELHGGTAAATSPGPGRGSEFVVRLPALAADARPAPAADRTPQPPAGRGRLRVLITDDNVDSAESMAILLERAGHEVRTAHDGPQALIVAQTFQPQAVFLDIGLPRGMDGHELARRMRRLPGLERALIVAMTGFGSPDDIERTRAAGFDHHLVKPTEHAEILRLLATVP